MSKSNADSSISNKKDSCFYVVVFSQITFKVWCGMVVGELCKKLNSKIGAQSSVRFGSILCRAVSLERRRAKRSEPKTRSRGSQANKDLIDRPLAGPIMEINLLGPDRRSRLVTSADFQSQPIQSRVVIPRFMKSLGSF
jgi:hypothetical protein